MLGDLCCRPGADLQVRALYMKGIIGLMSGDPVGDRAPTSAPDGTLYAGLSGGGCRSGRAFREALEGA